MKKPLLTLTALSLVGTVTAQTVLINEDFDSYSVGSAPATVNPAAFALWPGGGDQIVTDSIAHSGTQSMACIASAAAGGPGDLLLLLGDQTSGSFTLSWWMYIPSGKGGYFNIQHTEDVSAPSFAAEVVFLDGGSLDGMADNTAITGSYTQDAWFQVNLFFDLNDSTASFLIGSTPIATWDFATETDGAVGPNSLGAIDFFSYGGGAPTVGEYYVDDISYIQLPGGIGMGELATAAEYSVYPVPTSDVLTLAGPAGRQAQWRLLDATGRVVISASVAAERSDIDVSVLKAGVYTMEVLHGDQLERHTVVRN
ncbi:MAG: T9SS type A sorting domain-containing protein [Flavobacteriales bacterium]|nr:MAG: T9SS type A sorting domain-containing protein [Flavobacteriales bacterium]